MPAWHWPLAGAAAASALAATATRARTAAAARVAAELAADDWWSEPVDGTAWRPGRRAKRSRSLPSSSSSLAEIECSTCNGHEGSVGGLHGGGQPERVLAANR